MSQSQCVAALYRHLPRLGVPMAQLHLLAAVSGGADSVALLSALCAVRDETGCALEAVHVQHGLRGESSRADERFVVSLCERLRVPLSVCRADLRGDMHSPGIEQRARAERYRLFRQVLSRTDSHVLLCAHHRDDQAETVLMHLCRGAAADGLCGMRVLDTYEGMPILRPFLELPKAALLEELRQKGLSHCEDESNAEACTDRNRMRLQILPALRGMYAGADAAIARAAEMLAMDCDYVNEAAEALYRESEYHPLNGVYGLRRERIAGAAPALRTRVLRRLFDTCAEAIGCRRGERCLTGEETLALCAAVESGMQMNLPLGLRLFADGELLLLERQDGLPLLPPPEPISLKQWLAMPEQCYNGLRMTTSVADTVPRDAYTAVLPPALLDRDPLWRTARPQDRIHPLGASGGKPLRRYFTDCKLPGPLRMNLPLLCDGTEVLWIPGLCTSERLRRTGAERDGLCLTAERWRKNG